MTEFYIVLQEVPGPVEDDVPAPVLEKAVVIEEPVSILEKAVVVEEDGPVLEKSVPVEEVPVPVF